MKEEIDTFCCHESAMVLRMKLTLGLEKNDER